MRSGWLKLLLLGLLLLTAVDRALADGAAAVAFPNPEARPAPPGPVVARLAYADAAALGALTARLDVWEVHPAAGGGGWLLAYLTPAEWDELMAAGYTPQLDSARSAAARALPRRAASPSDGGIPGYPCYRTVAETYATLEELAQQRPDRVTLNHLGPSWERATYGPSAGHELLSLTLTARGASGPKPTLFVLAGVHARELAPVDAALLFAQVLLEDFNPPAQYLLEHYQVEILPLANPDGREVAERGYLQRKNTNASQGACAVPPQEDHHFGVDLNRNNAFQWAGAAAWPCAATYPGAAAASEPETQAIAARLRAVFPDRRGPGAADPADPATQGMFITLHSYGQYVLWPWAWSDAPAPDAAALATLGRKLAYYTHYWPQPASALYPAAGTHDDWVYGELGVPSFTIEMGTDFFQDCASYEKTLRWDVLDALYYALSVVDAPYQRGAGPEVTGLQVGSGQPQDWPVPGAPVTFTATVDGTRLAGGYTTGKIAAARAGWEVDLQPGGPRSTTLTAVDGAFDELVEEVAGTLPAPCAPYEGRLLVEGQAASGAWGPPRIGAVIIGDAYSLTAQPDAISFAPGATESYTLTLTSGPWPDGRYRLAINRPLPDGWGGPTPPPPPDPLPDGWTVDFPAQLGPLAPCETVTFPLTVAVPQTAAVGTTVNFALTAWNDNGLHLPAQLTARVGRVDFALGAADPAALFPGRTVTVTLPVTNTGELPLRFALDYPWTDASPALVNVKLREPPDALAAGASTRLTLTVIAPRGLAYPPPAQVTAALFALEDPRLRQTIPIPLTAWPRVTLPLVGR